MAIKFSQFNLRTDHTSGMYLVGYDGNQNIHITVDNLFDDFINGTENTIAMFGTDGTALADSMLSQNANATLLTVAGQLNVDSAATFDTSITVSHDSILNGNVTLGNTSTDLITQTGTLYLNGPVKDTTDTLGAVDQVLLSDATGELTFTDLADLHVGGAEVVEVPVKNVQGSALVKGDPVYISGSVGASGRLEVQLADASNTLKMPAVGLLKQDLANNAEGFAVVTGKLRNLITDPIDGVNPTENDVIYVKPSGTSGAALTTTKPVYGNFIQNVGKVGRVSTSNDGNLVVSSILRTNDIPNLTPGRLWVGSTGNTIESQALFVDEANGRLGIGTTTPDQNLTINGGTESFGLQVSESDRMTMGADGDWNYIKGKNGNGFRFSTFSGGDVLTLTNAGNVGIGTTSPGYPLDVQTTGSGDVVNIEAAGSAGIRLFNTSNSFATRIISLGAQTNFKSDGSIEFYTDGAASGSGIARMIIENSTGDVGIGTDPDIRLHVKDDVQTIAKFESTDENRSQIIVKNAAASNNQAYLMLSNPTTGKRRIALGGSNNPNNRDLLKIENQVATNYTDANMSFGSTGVSSQNKFAVTYDYNTDQDTPFNGIFIDANILGTTAITGDKTLTGLNVDMDCNASGGNQTQELQLRGINVDVVNKESGDANHIYGVWARASSTRNGTGDNITDITGGYFEAKNSAQTGQVSDMYGTYSYANIDDSTHTINNAFGSFARVAVANSFDGTISTKVAGSRIVTFLDDTNDNITPLLIGADVENVIDSNLATSEGVRVVKDINTNLTITDSYLFKGTVEKPASSTITNNWGLYLDNIDKNYLEGTLRLPTYGQGNVTGTATKNLAVDSSGNIIETEGGVVDGSGTTNYVAKWSDPNTLTDSVIYDDGTNVGIGTTSPGYKLDASGTIRSLGSDNAPGTGAGVELRYTGDGAGSVLAYDRGATSYLPIRIEGSTIDLREAGSSVVFVNAGKVGIGTTSPTSPLTVKSNSTSASDSGITIQANANTNPLIKLAEKAGDKARLHMYNAGVEKIAFYTDGTNNHISAGNVGIGTSSPARNLHIHQNDSTLSYLQITNSTTGTTGSDGVSFGITSDEIAVWNNRENTDTTISTNNTERLRITSAGNVGIGTTSPARPLHVNGAGINFVAEFQSTDDKASILIQDDDTLNYIHSQDGYLSLGGQNALSTNNLNINSSSGNVGIGTTSPSTKLEVAGTVGNFQTTGHQIFLTRNGNNEIYAVGASSVLALGTNNAEKMRIDSSGNVGIGTTSPSGKIHLLGAYNSQFFTQSTGGTTNKFGITSGTAYAAFTVGSSLTQAARFYHDNSYITFAENGANVGIGTTSPGEKLEVNGTIKTSTGLIKGANASAYINLDGTVGSRLRYGNQYLTANASHLVFSTNDNVRMTITNAGDVGIGTTSPGAKLDVNGEVRFNTNTGTTPFYVTRLGSIGESLKISVLDQDAIFESIQDESLDNYGGFQFRLDSGTTEPDFQIRKGSDPALFLVNGGGNVGIGTTSPNAKLEVMGGVGKQLRLSTGATTYWELGRSTSTGHFEITEDSGDTYFLIDKDNGNVGIGTTSPAKNLHIYDSSGGATLKIESNTANAYDSSKIELIGGNLSTGEIIFGDPIDSDVGKIIYEHDGNSLAFNVNASERMRIDSSGFVGIGTTSPNTKLDVRRSSNGIALELHQTAGSANDFVDMKMVAGNTSAGNFGTILRHARQGTGGGDFSILTNPTLTGTPVERLRVANDGSVGIGTTSPICRLHVVNGSSGQSYSSNISGVLIDVNGSSNSYYGLRVGSNISNANLAVTNAGRVGIGTASPVNKLDVVGNIGIDQYLLHNGDTDTFFGFPGNDATSIGTNGTERVRINSSGHVGIGTTAPGKTLDVNGDIRLLGTDRFLEAASPTTRLRNMTALPGGYIEPDTFNFRFDESATAYAGESHAIGGTISQTTGTAISDATLKRLFTYTAGYINLNTHKDSNNNVVIELDGISVSNSANNQWKPYVFFHSSASNVATMTIELKNGAGNWETVENAIDCVNFYIRNGFYQTSQGVLKGARFTFTNITGNSYLRMIGVIGKTHASYQWNVLKSGSKMFGDLDFGDAKRATFGDGEDLRILHENNNSFIHHNGGGNLYMKADTGSIEIINYTNDSDIVLASDDGSGGTTPYLTIDGSTTNAYFSNPGNVGIGTTSPSEKLDVSGNIALSGNIVDTNTNESIEIGVNDVWFEGKHTHSSFGVWARSGGNGQRKMGIDGGTSYMGLYTNSTEKVRIDTNGKVGIGTTSPGTFLHIDTASTDNIPLTVESGASTSYVHFLDTGTTANFKVRVGSNGDNLLLWAGGSERMRIAADGGLFVYDLLGSSSVSNPQIRYDVSTKELYYQSSSLRYKEEVENLDSQIDKLMNLRTVKFKIKGTNENAIGLIAEEVVEVIPELTFKNEVEGFDEPQIDGVSYGDLPTYLLKAIQEQQEMINELKTEIQTLKSQINS